MIERLTGCIAFFGIFAVVSASAQQKNTPLIEKMAGSALTPHIAINKKDPLNWMASLGNKIVYTKNGGKSWVAAKTRSTLNNYGEADLITNGKTSFVHIQAAGPGKNATDSVRDRIAGRTTEDGGVTWTEELSFFKRPPFGQSHPRATGDRGTVYLTWTEFEHDLPKDSACVANILFSMSSSEGKKWSDPIRINTVVGSCQGRGMGMQASAPELNLEEKLFVLWSNNGVPFMDRSYDGGRTWLSNDLAVARVTTSPTVDVPGVLSEMIVPDLAIDKSFSYFKGSLYLIWSDRMAGRNDSDIWFTRSTNRGDFWTEPQKVNKDSTQRDQFLPTMVVDEATGVLYVAYYDRREAENTQTNIYLSYSVDGGSSFNEVKVSERSFAPGADLPIESPVALEVHKGVILIAWTSTEGGSSTLWSAALRQNDLIKQADLPRIQQIHKR